MKFRDRIIGTVRVWGNRATHHPKNWRVHDEFQQSVIEGTLQDIGIAGSGKAVPEDPALIAEALALKTRAERQAWAERFEASGARILILDGHLRETKIRDQPAPYELLDLNEREQAQFIATFDPIGDLAKMDRDKFVDLAADFNSTNAAVQALVADLAALKPDMVDFGLEGDGGGEEGSGVSGGAPAGEDEEEPVIPTDALIEKWNTAPGQLWVVPSLTVPGREHRLLCGDCRDSANVERLRNGATPKLGLHDPPYGIAIVSKTGSTLGDGRPIAQRAPGNGQQARTEWTRRGKFAPIEGDANDFDPRSLLNTAPRVVLWGANNFPGSLPPSNEWIAWDKKATADGGSIGANSFSDFELAFVSPVSGKTGHSRMIRHLWSGLIRASEKGEQRLHPTQKPIAVQQQIVEWYSEPGDDVEDWYMGAGAVIIACEQTGRIGHGMDIAHAYLAATLERLSQRGLTPRLAV